MKFFIILLKREDNGRIILQRARDGSCKGIIKRIQFMDGGEWTFSIEVKGGQNKTLKKHRHTIDVRQNGSRKRLLNELIKYIIKSIICCQLKYLIVIISILI